ncbi:cytochrome c oxidase subunit II [Neiella marina]|uniref:Cytochrome c oxidase subunit 2 n=1 Tax=Neiella holothuriorum TaxID=2870530 RepID=A0ABS7EFZ0_9GAMM|nr:cytochrome c oxidase subunit II [Neiella holothuriorum]MBW8191233.1 cytochrome c oxidase subunit II [Neiella holothuriorum]
MPLNLTKGVTDISDRVYDLHMTIFYICCIIGFLVFGVMFYSIVRHRKSRGVKPANFHESTKIELLWTAIPFVILIGMAIPATNTLIAMENSDDADLTVLVTGSQWKWHYRYLEHDLEYYSVLATPRRQIENKLAKGQNYLLEVDRPLVIPTNTKVRFLMTSDDVIHSWWVPEFAVKKDANPGFINEAWTNVPTAGIYRGQCAELCGKDHGFMPVVVIAKEPEEFQSWLASQQAEQQAKQAEEQRLLALQMPKDELMDLGKRTYDQFCAACHQPNGQGLPGMFPALKGSDMVMTDAAAHIDIVLYGKAGTAMAGFGKQLSLKELAAVVTYERNAWGNDTGELIQAADIEARRKAAM